MVFFEQVPGWREFVWREGTPLALTRRYVSLATLPFALLGLAFCVRGARPARARALGLGAAAGAGFLLSPGPGLAEWPVPPPYAIAQKLGRVNRFPSREMLDLHSARETGCDDDRVRIRLAYRWKQSLLADQP